MSRIWRTTDGRHVPDGDPDAAFLLYGPGDPVPQTVLDEVEGKAKPKPADKERPVNEDKGGVTVSTRDSVIRALEDLGHKVDRRKSTETLRAELDETQAAAAPGAGEEE